MSYRILKIDPYLAPFEKDIDLRMDLYKKKRAELLGKNGDICDFANAHHYFGFHKTADGWFYREWAPSADSLYLTGDFCNWEPFAHRMNRLDGGVFERRRAQDCAAFRRRCHGRRHACGGAGGGGCRRPAGCGAAETGFCIAAEGKHYVVGRNG